jgi:hypothetical protein
MPGHTYGLHHTFGGQPLALVCLERSDTNGYCYAKSTRSRMKRNFQGGTSCVFPFLHSFAAFATRHPGRCYNLSLPKSPALKTYSLAQR